MRFSQARVRAVLWKEITELRKNRLLLLSLAVFPVVFVVMPILIVTAYVHAPNDPSLRAMATFFSPDTPVQDAAGFVLDRILSDWITLFLILPTFVPILLSANAIAGEREKRTLEPLLASPVQPAELLLGKSLASLAPAVFLSVIAFAAVTVLVDVIAWPTFGRLLLPTPSWLLGIFLLAPLFAFLGNGIAVLISARVSDARLAQQLAGLFVLPLVGIAIAQFAGAFRGSILGYLLMAAIVAALDVLLVVLARSVIDRERLLTRWG